MWCLLQEIARQKQKIVMLHDRLEPLSEHHEEYVGSWRKNAELEFSSLGVAFQRFDALVQRLDRARHVGHDRIVIET